MAGLAELKMGHVKLVELLAVCRRCGPDAKGQRLVKAKKLKFSAGHEANRTDGDLVYVCRPSGPRFGRNRLIATDSSTETQLACSAAGSLVRLMSIVRANSCLKNNSSGRVARA